MSLIVHYTRVLPLALQYKIKGAVTSTDENLPNAEADLLDGFLLACEWISSHCCNVVTGVAFRVPL